MDGVLVQAAALTAVVTFLVSSFKPFVEQVPFARPGAATHDATIQLLNAVLNIGLVLAIAAASGDLTAQSALPLALQALGQMAGAELLYKRTTRSGGSVASSSVAAPAPVPAPADSMI